jgi:hypothetical protein
MDAAFDALEALTIRPKIHMLRGLNVVDEYPFTSADSTNLARSFKKKGDEDDVGEARLLRIRDRTEMKVPPLTFKRRACTLLPHEGHDL